MQLHCLFHRVLCNAGSADNRDWHQGMGQGCGNRLRFCSQGLIWRKTPDTVVDDTVVDIDVLTSSVPIKQGLKGHLMNPVALRTSYALLIVLTFVITTDGTAEEKVNATTLHQKVLCGYQGWFRCPGDGSGESWLHWSRNRREVTPQSLTVEMWPDMSEYRKNERFLVPGFTGPDNQRMFLFSSANQSTVERHFEWMREYGIDGVFVQRFLVNLKKPSFDTVLKHVRSSAKKSGRIYAVGYDLSGASRIRCMICW